MTESEKEMFLSVSTQEFNTYWIPCAWFIHLLRDYKDSHPDMDETGLKLIMEVSVRSSFINKFYRSSRYLLIYSRFSWLFIYFFLFA